ncbi:BatA domain-containing protein [Paraglaciecola aestuariivivens]
MSSLGFWLQSPLALWGLLALLIPLAIHLLSKSRAKIVPFAHLALITVKASPRLRQLRLTQWLLLLLRSLLLLIATFVLAQLYWQTGQTSNHPHILLTQDWLEHASDTERSQLLEQYSVANFTLLDQANLALTSQQISQWPKPPSTAEVSPLNVWEKVEQYAAQLPKQTPVIVYSTNRLSQFLGNKLPSVSKLNWQIKSLPSNEREQRFQASVLVLFEEVSAPSMPYVKAAFDALNTHQQIELAVQYSDLSKLNADIKTDVILNLSTAELAKDITSSQASLIGMNQLGALEQPDFPLVLFDLLFNQPLQNGYFQNARLSEQQIIMSSPANTVQQNPIKSPNPHTQALHLWLILLLVMIFAAERLLSEWQPVDKKIAVDS